MVNIWCSLLYDKYICYCVDHFIGKNRLFTEPCSYVKRPEPILAYHFPGLSGKKKKSTEIVMEG